MKRRLAVAAAAVAVLAAVVIFFLTRTVVAPTMPAPPPAETAKPVAVERKSIPIEQLSGTVASPQQKIQRVYLLVQNYRQVVRPPAGSPVSSNREYTQALTGGNPRKIRFLPPNHPSISAGGELLDAWDTPYFFHDLAADSVEVVSAGPDRIHFNTDDLVFPPPKPQSTLLGSIRSKGMRDGAKAMKRPGGPP